jgi:hypothetical protein
MNEVQPFNFLIVTYSIIILELHLSSIRGAKSLTEMWGFFVTTCFGQFYIPPKQTKMMNFGELYTLIAKQKIPKTIA